MEDTDQTRWEELLRCTVCHDTFKDPRQLPCGHSMCMDCLTKLLDHSTDSPFRCPDCRADFGQVVELQKSYALASIAEDFRLIKKRRADETLAECVYCDCCPETKTAAFKSCLKCEVSLCREHMKDHLELQAFTGHPLVDPLSDLLERKCPQHRDQVLRYYCCSSRRYVCNMCALESKQLGSASDASAVLRRQLTQMNESINAVRTQHESEGLQLELQHSDLGQRITTVLHRYVKLCFISINQSILWTIQGSLVQSNVDSKPKFGKHCLQYIFTHLVKRDTLLFHSYHYSVENQTLADALERQQSRVHHIYSSIAGGAYVHSDSVPSSSCTGHMADHPLKRLSEDEGGTQAPPTGQQGTAFSQGELQSFCFYSMCRLFMVLSCLKKFEKNYFKRMYRCGESVWTVTFDLDTASRLLGLSADLRTVERVKAALHYPNSDGRFDQAPQVLSAPCFSSGAHVWEVEAEGCWDIAVSYRSVPRRSRDGSSAFGHNSESWSLSHSGQGELFAFHDGHRTALPGSLPSSRIAVEVNFEEGRIGFSAVGATETLLHEFKAELTQPVCLGLGLHHVDPPSRASIVK
uniref:Uncharacterized protein n=1 Tax=Poecilia formosa TaxID=48698 RepID=A0A096M2L0_POEFO